MPAYRLYCIGEDGAFVRGRWLAADDDAQAITYARETECDNHRCELWERSRLVANIPRNPKQP